MTVQVMNARRGNWTMCRTTSCRKIRLAFGVMLTPGLNTVDAAAWAQCRDHPVTNHYVQRGDVTEVVAASGSATPNPIPVVRNIVTTPSEPSSDPDAARYGEPESPPLGLEEASPSQGEPITGYPVVSPATDDAIPDLTEMRAKDAITALLSINDKWTLRQLLAVEVRTTVVRAINRRLEEVTGS